MKNIILRNRFRFKLRFLVLALAIAIMGLTLLALLILNIIKERNKAADSAPVDISANIPTTKLIKEVIYISKPEDFAKYDFANFGYKNAFLENGLLNINIDLGDGCSDHEFNLLVDKTQTQDINQPYRFILAHTSSKGICTAIITSRSLIFNLANFFHQEGIDPANLGITDMIKVYTNSDIQSEPFLVISGSKFKELKTPGFNAYSAVDIVRAKNPELYQYSLIRPTPQKLIYTIETLDGWYIAFIQKQNTQIVSAICYKVDDSKIIAYIGEYKYELSSSFMATDINPTNCQVENVVKANSGGLKEYLGSNPANINTEDGITPSKIEARKALLAAHPEFKVEDIALPPVGYYFYLNPEQNGWYVIRTHEGSGVQAIFAATCYEVKQNAEIKTLGDYDGISPLTSKITSTDKLDPSTCKVD